MALDILPALLSRRERRAREDVNEEDLLAAVQRHRMEKLQAELKRLQGGATSGR